MLWARAIHMQLHVCLQTLVQLAHGILKSTLRVEQVSISHWTLIVIDDVASRHNIFFRRLKGSNITQHALLVYWRRRDFTVVVVRDGRTTSTVHHHDRYVLRKVLVHKELGTEGTLQAALCTLALGAILRHF